ncbi:MAG: hypothetical protein L0312_34160 [Acidobacteria bacterium]|nr:hypothetical protein [Acidobacteriota bacterium]
MRKHTQTKKDNQKAISRKMREKVAVAIKGRPVSGSLKDYTFAQFRRAEFERTGRQLMDLVDARRSGPLADQWVQCPKRFPFYSAFVEGFLYNGYYAIVEHNEPLDRNARTDYEQLAYLTWADLVVSDDQRFFRNAFQAIWKPRGKRLETSEGLVSLTQRLV